MKTRTKIVYDLEGDERAAFIVKPDRFDEDLTGWEFLDGVWLCPLHAG